MIWGVQQFQLRQEFDNEQQAQATLAAIRTVGFTAIELNDFMLHPMSLGVRLLCRMAGMPLGGGGRLDWPTLVSDAGLQVIGLHIDLNSFLKAPAAYLETAQALATHNLIITGMRRFDYCDDQAVASLCQSLNHAGELAQKHGYQLLYHNHNTEFRRMADGRIAYQAVMEETNTEFVNFEFDAYWATEAGVDVIAWMTRLGPRLRLLHLTDRAPVAKGASGPILKSQCTELGSGVMPLSAIVEQAKTNHIEAVILESTANWLDHSGLRSMQRSAEFIHQLQLAGESDE